MDPAQDDDLPSPSRSARRRAALAVFALAERLVALTAVQLQRIPLDADLRAAVDFAQRIRSHIARKRQVQTLAKLLRALESERLEAIRAAVDRPKQVRARETAALNRLEQWRLRLLTEGEVALTELRAAQPGIDVDAVRSAVQAALAERAGKGPRGAARALFRTLRRQFEPPEASED